jgi:murein DD-endopeptidase MepM/ murein hydrolase activator NlpD
MFKLKHQAYATKYFILVGLIFFLSACAIQGGRNTNGIWYILNPGDTLEKLAQTYNVSVLEIRKQNDIYDPKDLSAGMKIFIPGVKTDPKKKRPAQSEYLRFDWPANGTISSGFGKRYGRMHEGIDITKDGGRDVRAAASGKVEFVGSKGSFGKTVVINHGRGMKTVYAHNERIYVKKGMTVRRGVIIAKMGSSGRSTGIHLHFEIRKRGKAQNPLRYLPAR